MKILICEDDQHLMDMMCLALPSHETLCASTLQEAQKLAGSGWDCAFIDVGLPDGSGLELCRSLRKTTARPIVLISGAVGEENQLRGYAAMADDYLEKPFSLAVLRAKTEVMERHLKKRDLLQPDLLLQPCGMLCAGSQRVRLNATAAVIVRLLLEQSGPVSFEQMRAALSEKNGRERDMSNQTLMVCVSEIKKRLQPLGWNVRGIRGCGYVLEKLS